MIRFWVKRFGRGERPKQMDSKDAPISDATEIKADKASMTLIAAILGEFEAVKEPLSVQWESQSDGMYANFPLSVGPNVLQFAIQSEPDTCAWAKLKYPIGCRVKAYKPPDGKDLQYVDFATAGKLRQLVQFTLVQSKRLRDLGEAWRQLVVQSGVQKLESVAKTKWQVVTHVIRVDGVPREFRFAYTAVPDQDKPDWAKLKQGAADFDSKAVAADATVVSTYCSGLAGTVFWVTPVTPLNVTWLSDKILDGVGSGSTFDATSPGWIIRSGKCSTLF